MIELPKKFTEEDLKYLGGNKEWKQFIGIPRVSYSSLSTLWDTMYTKDGLGDLIKEQFFGVKKDIHPSYGEFGDAVEKYICEKIDIYGFSKEEKRVLDTITPLGKFQVPFVIPFNDFVLIGYKDDVNDKRIRDYKTGSESSSQKYFGEDYKQLHIYNLDSLINKGRVKEMEVVIIERNGNPYKGEKLTVGSQIWSREILTNEKELLSLKKKIEEDVFMISDLYTTYKKLNV